MNEKVRQTGFLTRVARSLCVILLCEALLAPGNAVVLAQTAPQAPAVGQESTTIPPEQLESLVAPIALYPDNLLAQVLVASTYPLELVQLQQWLQKNPDLVKDQKKLADKVKKQPWDPSIQAMAALPDTVKFLTEDISWTTDLGNAFLAQQKDVMDAVQRMRGKAQTQGALKSNEQMTVQTQTVESKEIIVIQQSNPEVVYVPQYNPTVVYGAAYPAYPYPPVDYPPYYGTGAAIAAGAIGFGVGMMVGAAWGGGWGWGCGWGGGDVDINMNNNFNRNTNISGGNRVNNIQGGNRGKWQHNPTHRGGAPYGDRNTANRFGGTTRGDTLGNRQRAAQRDLGNRGNRSDFGNRGGVGDRGGIGDRGGVGNNRGDLGNRGGVGNNRGDIGNRGGVGNNRGDLGNRGSVGDRGGAGVNNRASFGGDRGSSGNRGGSSGSSDRVGSRDLSNRSGSGGFGGRSDGFSGGSARSSSSRGMSSMGGSRGGGFSGGSRGGGMSRGGGGGMSRGGGGRRR
jgi:hypothetical protein